jgi:hypothetical protein
MSAEILTQTDLGEKEVDFTVKNLGMHSFRYGWIQVLQQCHQDMLKLHFTLLMPR